MEEEDYDNVPTEARHYYLNIVKNPSPEKEIGELSDGKSRDVYVAVGKNDIHVLKWTLDHDISPVTRVFLIHVFPPLTHIPTPIGKLAIRQLNEEQVNKYAIEEINKRKRLMEKYIELCNDAKVAVETMLIESNMIAKSIIHLVHVLNITQLVIGTKHPPTSRRRVGIGEVVKQKLPDSCKVSIVCDGKKVEESREVTQNLHASSRSPREFRKKMCGCFP